MPGSQSYINFIHFRYILVTSRKLVVDELLDIVKCATIVPGPRTRFAEGHMTRRLYALSPYRDYQLIFGHNVT
jgi:hypothetical protein